MSNSAKLTTANKKSIRLAEGSQGKTKMTPTTAPGAKTFPLQKELFDLDSFADVKLGKKYQYTPVTSVQEALGKLGNDNEKLIAALNDGLRAEQVRQERANPSGWFIMDDEGELTDKPFNGTLADIKKVNSLVLTLAKTVYQLVKTDSADIKAQKKDQARALIQGNPAMREGLKQSAALTVDADDAEAA